MGKSYEANNTSLEASDTGTGKTRVSCALAKWKDLSIFVLCPKGVVETWFKTAKIFNLDILGVANYEAAKTGKFFPDVESYLKDKREDNPYVWPDPDNEVHQYSWDLPENTLVIFDEAHKGKNHITQNAKLFLSVRQNFPTNKCIILSATIIDKIECFHFVTIMMGITQEGKHAYRVWLRNISKDTTPVAAIHGVIFPKYGARMTVRNIKASQDLATRNIFAHNDILAEVHDVNPKVEEEINAAYNDIREALENLKHKSQKETCILTVLLRARQRIELLKAPLLSMLAMEWLSSNKSVILFVNFNDTINQLFDLLKDFVDEELKSFITVIRGGQTTQERNYQKNAFLANKSCLMIANIQSGGVGIDMNDIDGDYPRVVLISPPWSSIALKQSLGRADRAGTRSPIIQRIVYCRGKVSEQGAAKTDTTFVADNGRKLGIEEVMAQNLNKKLNTIEWINNGDDEDLITL
jgi:superfamily II DNA or RNA helicase